MGTPVDPKLKAAIDLAKRLTDKLPPGTGHPSARQILGAVGALTEGARALHNLRTTRNPSETDAAHTKRVMVAAERLGRENTEFINRVARFTQEGHADIGARIADKTKLNPDGYAPEVREVYRGMSQTEKTALLNELLEQKRGPEFAAIVKAPTSLTGMREEFRQQYIAAYIERHAPAEAAEARLLDEVMNDALISADTVGALANSYNDPAKLAEIMRAEAAAEAAAKAFDGVVSAK